VSREATCLANWLSAYAPGRRSGLCARCGTASGGARCLSGEGGIASGGRRLRGGCSGGDVQPELPAYRHRFADVLAHVEQHEHDESPDGLVGEEPVEPHRRARVTVGAVGPETARAASGTTRSRSASVSAATISEVPDEPRPRFRRGDQRRGPRRVRFGNLWSGA